MRGVVYCATGEDYVSEAKTSARSLKEHNPSLSITLFTDEANQAEIFDEIRQISSSGNGFLDFIRAMELSPYEQTLFLDVDTYITDDITEMYRILDKFDFAASMLPGHGPTGERDYSSAPPAFPTYHSGVILYNKTDSVMDLIRDWRESFQQAMDKGEAKADEIYLTRLLWERDVNLSTLPPEYNCRFHIPGAVAGKVKILHARHPDMTAMAERLNEERGMRAFTGSYHRRIISGPRPTVTLSYPGSRTRFVIDRLREIYSQEGMSGVYRVLSKRWRRMFPF